MIKKALLILNQFSNHMLCNELERVFKIANIQFVILNLPSLFSGDNHKIDNACYIQKILKMGGTGINDYLMQFRKKILINWLLKSREVLESKYLLIINHNIDAKLLYDEGLFMEIKKYFNIIKVNFNIIFCINAHHVKNPYYFLTCLLELLVLKKQLYPNSSIFIFLENFNNMKNDINRCITTLYNVNDLIDFLIPIYKPHYLAVVKLLINLKKKIFYNQGIKILYKKVQVIQIIQK
uniref:Uncharacterized protein n=1 Tax=Lotharella vacuolata TaxID=74820 RepID=A0A0H5BL43_9EUKA|nr:hypothetical protein [Lotharella vacuolata]